jgi:hypothetical protein
MAVTPLVPLTMFSCIPLILMLFQRWRSRPRLAVITGFLLSFLFLPNHDYALPLLPDYDKINAACYGVLLGTAIYHPEVFRSFRFSHWDLPVVVWCITPFFTSLSNGLGAYDGLVTLLGQISQWGVPYLLGRLYFCSRQALEELALGIFLGALIYIPFCLYEVVMSPRLHKIIYGFHPHDFSQAKRGGGWRPVVFMHHGLMNAMFMLSGFLAGWGLWLSGRLKAALPAPLKSFGGIALLLLFITMLLLKSTGALALMVMGLLLLLVFRLVPVSLPLRVMLVLPLLYVTTRSTELWDGQNLIDAAASVTSEERTGSLSYRIYNETILSEHAWQRPLLGWGGWKRSFVTNSEGEIVSVPDGMWILAFGKFGYLGLYSLMLVFAVPVYLFLRHLPAKSWRDPKQFAILAMPVLLLLFALDSLLNDMFNPLMPLIGGGVVGLALSGESDDASDVEKPASESLSTRPRLL